MNKNFLKSVITGVVSLGLIASCSQLTGKKDSHKCSAKKADEANKCSSKKAAEVKTDAKSETKSAKAKKSTK
jgi:hypothetical protein